MIHTVPTLCHGMWFFTVQAGRYVGRNNEIQPKKDLLNANIFLCRYFCILEESELQSVIEWWTQVSTFWFKDDIFLLNVCANIINIQT